MWEEINGKLHKTFVFKNFSEAFAFMTRVAFIAEQNNHHPNWSNVWNRVDINLCTHEAGDSITEKDTTMAQAIDRLITS